MRIVIYIRLSLKLKKTPYGVLKYKLIYRYYFSNLAGNGSLCTLSFATSYVFLAVDFVRPFRASKSYARN